MSIQMPVGDRGWGHMDLLVEHLWSEYLNLLLTLDFNLMTSVAFSLCTLFFSSFVLLPLEQEYRLSICGKICYAIGGAPNQVAGSAAAFFLQIYLLDIAHVSSTRNLYRL